jgi:hypothetical protein
MTHGKSFTHREKIMDRRGFVERLAMGAAMGASLAAAPRPARAQATAAPNLWANVKQFGAVGDGATDDTAAINAALGSLQRTGYERGGVLYFPAGHYKCSSTIAVTSWNAAGEPGAALHNIIVRGDGPGCTIVDFASAPAGSSGISFNHGAHFRVEDIEIANAPGSGIVIADTSGFSSFFAFRNLRIQFCGLHGLQMKNAYMGTLEDIWSAGNQGNGFEMDGFHTSIEARRCYASSNTGIGWALNGMTYSVLSSCGSDNNHTGYALSNLAGVHISACGAESNSTDAWLVNANTASTAGLPSQICDIHGLVLTSCFSTGNNTAGPYASHLSVTAGDQRTVEIKLLGNVSWLGGGFASVALNANSGHIRIIDEMNRFEGTWVTSGDVVRHIPY